MWAKKEKKEKNVLEATKVVVSDQGYRSKKRSETKKIKKNYSSGQTRWLSRMVSKQIIHPIALDRDDSPDGDDLPDQLRYTSFVIFDFFYWLFFFIWLSSHLYMNWVWPGLDDCAWLLDLCMYVWCLYVCMYVCMYVYIYMCDMYIFICVCVCVYIYMCMYTYIHTYYMYVYIFTYTFILRMIHTYINVYIFTYTFKLRMLTRPCVPDVFLMCS
jgi:hypothetical protein